MPDPQLYLLAMGGAALVSAFLVLAMAWALPAGATWLNSACVLGIGLGLAAGFGLMSFRLKPPINALDRLLMIVVPAALSVELIAGLRSVPRWLAWTLRLSLAAVIPRILLHGSVYVSRASGEWTASQAATALAVCGMVLAGLWCLLLWLSERSPGISISFALCLAILCAGATVMMAGYIKGGSAAFPFAAALAATAVTANLHGNREAGTGGAILGIGVVSLFGLLFIGRFFGEVSTAWALALLLAPLLCWASELPKVRQSKPWLIGAIRLSLVAIPLAAVLTLAKRDFDRDMVPLMEKQREPVSTCPDRALGGLPPFAPSARFACADRSRGASTSRVWLLVLADDLEGVSLRWEFADMLSRGQRVVGGGAWDPNPTRERVSEGPA